MEYGKSQGGTFEKKKTIFESSQAVSATSVKKNLNKKKLLENLWPKAHSFYPKKTLGEHR